MAVYAIQIYVNVNARQFTPHTPTKVNRQIRMTMHSYCVFDFSHSIEVTVEKNASHLYLSNQQIKTVFRDKFFVKMVQKRTADTPLTPAVLRRKFLPVKL